VTAVIETGTANLASMLAALRRVGLSPETTQSPERVIAAERVVLPGVGAFGAGMAQMERLGLGNAIRARVDRQAPLLAVCLGLQLLCTGSEETPGVDGLAILPVAVGRFVSAPIIPQLGWNRVVPATPEGLVSSGYA
jgi:imidazole glycerol phosphate synthase glutamine amidotransferase subunit